MGDRRSRTAWLCIAITGATAIVSTPAVRAADTDIALSEVMYHAADGLADDDDDYDFVELINRGDAPVDLLGWQIADAVDFVFEQSLLIEPGGFVVVAHDANAFAERYGMQPDGEWDGKLKNSSETIELLSPESTLIDLLDYNDDPPWPGAADGGGRSLERLDLDRPNLGDDSDAVNWLASGDLNGTPRAENSVLTSGPLILDVDDGSERPVAAVDIPISAEIFNADSVSVTYKVGFGDEFTMPMLDDESSEGGAGDGVYTALLPAQAARTLVRYSITATNENGPTTSPADTDTIFYHGVVTADPAEPNDIPVLDYFITEPDYALLLGEHRYTDITSPIVVSFGDTVVDNATVRVRGNKTRDLPKPSLRIELPKGHLISFDGNTAEPVDEFNLHWRNDLKADLGWEIAAELGLPLVEFFGMRVYRNGDFWGSGAYLSAIDGRWREANGYDDAAVYKGERVMVGGKSLEDAATRWDKKAGVEGDYTDIWELSNLVVDRADDEQFDELMETLDVSAVVNYWAYVSFLNQVDSWFKNFYLVRDPEGTGRWHIDLWDLNLASRKGNLFSNQMPLIETLNQHAVFRDMHARRLRSMIDSYTTGELIQRFDDRYDVALDAFEEDREIWRQGTSPATLRNTWVRGIPVRYKFFAANTDKSRRSLPVSQSAARPIEISAVTPASGVMPAFVELSNTSSTESFDLSGWTLSGVDHTIAPGTVLLPGAAVVVTSDDVAYREATNGAFAAGEFDELPEIGVVALTDADGQSVDLVAYGGPDVDGDGIDNELDNCSNDANPGQEDADGDGLGDVCDSDPDDGPLGDVDGDEVANVEDNCPAIANPGQEDANENGVGDACDEMEDDAIVTEGTATTPTVSVTLTGDSALVTWSDMGGANQQYQFRVRENFNPYQQEKIVGSLEKTLTGLNPTSTYRVEVRTKISGSWRGWTRVTIPPQV